MGNRYHLTASEGVGLVSEKRREAGGVLIPIRFRAGLEVVYPDIGVLVRWFLPRGLSDERDMARYI